MSGAQIIQRGWQFGQAKIVRVASSQARIVVPQRRQGNPARL